MQNATGTALAWPLLVTGLVKYGRLDIAVTSLTKSSVHPSCRYLTIAVA